MARHRIDCVVLAASLVMAAVARTFVPLAAFADAPTCAAELEEAACIASSDAELRAGLLNANISSITLGGDIEGEGGYDITREVSIDGGGHNLVSTSTSVDALKVSTGAVVEIKNLNIDTKYRAITVYDKKPNLTVDEVEVLAYRRGVTVYNGMDGEGMLMISNSEFKLSPEVLGSDNYETAAYSGGYKGISYDEARGVALWGVRGGKVTIENTGIYGFWTAMNINGGDMTGTVIDVKDSTLTGRSGMNLNGVSNATINVSGGRVHGVHTFPGTSESFADIVLEYNTSNMTLNVDGVEFTNYLSDAALNDKLGDGATDNTARQYMIAKRDYLWLSDEAYEKNIINISGNTTFIDYGKDKMDRVTTVFEPRCGGYEVEEVPDSEEIVTACPEMNVSGGTYSYDDVALFVDYDVNDVYHIESDDVYVVAPITTYDLDESSATIKYGTTETVKVNFAPAKVGAYDNPNTAYTVTSDNAAIKYDKTTGEVSTTSSVATTGTLTFKFYDGKTKTVNITVEGLKVEVGESEGAEDEEDSSTTKNDAQEVVDAILSGETAENFTYAEGVDENDVFAAAVAGDVIKAAVTSEEMAVTDVAEEALLAITEVIDGELDENSVVAGYFDIDVALMNVTADKVLGYLTELSDEITVTIEIPDDATEVKDGYRRVYYVVRYHGTEAEILPAVDNGDGTISFDSKLFSTYALVYTDTETTVAPGAAVSTPETGLFTSEDMSVNARISQLTGAIACGSAVFLLIFGSRRVQVAYRNRQRRLHINKK